MSDHRHNILIVDDDPSVLKTMCALLDDEYDTVSAQSLEQGLSCLHNQPENPGFSAILADQHLGDGYGNSLLFEAREVFPDATRIIISGAEDQNATKEAINKQLVHQYITKDANVLDEITRACRSAIAAFNDRLTLREKHSRKMLHYKDQICEERAQIILSHLPVAFSVIERLHRVQAVPPSIINQWQLIHQEHRYQAALGEFFSAYSTGSDWIRRQIQSLDGRTFQTHSFSQPDFRNSLVCMSSNPHVWRESHALVVAELLGKVVDTDDHRIKVQL